MKVLILAGGYGTRLSEETDLRPKPMVEIGGKPMIWHIMKIYSHYGFNEFVILLGYKGYVIKEYFANYLLHKSDITIDLAKDKVEVHSSSSEPWKITLIDTGRDTMTGGRIRRAKQYIENQPFMLTYGDGVCDVNIKTLVDFHSSHSGAVTMTAVKPEGKYGKLTLGSGTQVLQFNEKPRGDGEENWINGGFFVCNPEVFQYLEGDDMPFESRTLERLSAAGELFAFKHDQYWCCMDTLRDKKVLNEAWDSGSAKWKVWS